ncbi:MAG: YggT family protein [Bradymonadia bacterium]
MLAQLIQVVIYLVIADAVLSWLVAPDAFPRNITVTMVEPLCAPLRKLLPSSGGLDLTHFILIVLLSVVQALVS